MLEKKVRVAHVLGKLTYGGGQLQVLALIEDLPEFNHIVLVEGGARADVEEQFAQAAEVVHCPYRPGHPVEFFLRLVRTLRRERPDVILAHLFGNHTLVSWAAFLARVPATYGVSTNDPVHYARSRWQPMILAQAARPFCRGVIAVSHEVGRILRTRLHLPMSQVTVIPNGCRIEDIAARAAAARAARQRDTDAPARILMAASIGRTKDHPTALRALEILKRQGRNVEMWFAGLPFRETGQRNIEALANELGVADHVRWLGARSDVPELMGASEILLHVTHSEGFGVATIEAMAAGIPVVATNVGALREVLDDGRCGVLVPDGNAVATAEALARLLDDKALREKLVAAASERVRGHYDMKRMSADYAALIRRATSRATASY